MAESVLLMSAWRGALSALGVDLTGAVLLAAPDGGALARAAGVPVRAEGVTLVTIGAGQVPELPEGAAPAATGAPDASFDAVVFLAAWETQTQLGEVALEATRIVRPGCRLFLGDLDAQALTQSMPAAYMQAVLYQAHREVGERLLARHAGPSQLALAALGAGLHSVAIEAADLPIGAFTSAAEYVEAVRAGLWEGRSELDESVRDDVLASLHRRLAGALFPMVAYQPWLLAHGFRPW